MIVKKHFAPSVVAAAACGVRRLTAARFPVPCQAGKRMDQRMCGSGEVGKKNGRVTGTLGDTG